MKEEREGELETKKRDSKSKTKVGSEEERETGIGNR
jgi:hypothetical protein